LIDRKDLEVSCERLHLVSPRVPEIREAVDHDDDRAVTDGCIVDAHVSVVHKAALGGREEVCLHRGANQ
jgi:hypothetical protein